MDSFECVSSDIQQFIHSIRAVLNVSLHWNIDFDLLLDLDDSLAHVSLEIRIKSTDSDCSCSLMVLAFFDYMHQILSPNSELLTVLI